MQIAATILAGGKASRLQGQAKGNIQLPSQQTIIERLIAELEQSGVNPIAISSNDAHSYQRYQLPLIPDRHQNIGPIAGIVAALQYFSLSHQAVLFCPCDLPKIGAKEFTTLCNGFKQRISYCQTTSGLHPLCALIPTAQLPEIIAQIDNGIYKLRVIWENLQAQAITFPDETPFYNVNSTMDLIGIN